MPPISPDDHPSRSDASDEHESKTSRRNFLRFASTGLVGAGLLGEALGQDTTTKPTAATTGPTPQLSSLVSVKCEINGVATSLDVDPRTSLADTLRETLQLTGTKVGCNQGACGACTVHINGQRVLSCLTLAATVSGKKVTTIEGLEDLAGADDDLHPLQREFLQCDGYQCGYCTPGQIMSGVACIHEGHANGDVEEVREWMSGNLCRCGAYPNIVQAIQNAREETVALTANGREVR